MTFDRLRYLTRPLVRTAKARNSTAQQNSEGLLSKNAIQRIAAEVGRTVTICMAAPRMATIGKEYEQSPARNCRWWR